jgi:hypothetical protein
MQQSQGEPVSLDAYGELSVNPLVWRDKFFLKKLEFFEMTSMFSAVATTGVAPTRAAARQGSSTLTDRLQN